MTKNAWKLDRRLTAMMVEDMIFDPILAAKVILRIKVPPHEELRILWMWTYYYTNDDSGFSTGKSFTHGVVSALRSCLMPGRVSGIISKTYAQGKLIFANFDRWYNNNPIYRSCIKTQGGKPRIVHGADAHVVEYVGGAETRVLPPNFMQDAERLKSERWHDAYCDEWTTYGNFEAFNKTVVGRVTKENHNHDHPIFQNHIHLSSTPNFTYHPSYAMIRRLDEIIASGVKDHGRFSCNYRHVPEQEEYKFLINRKVIFTMQTSLPAGVVKTEVDGLWEKDSLSFYSALRINDVRRMVPLQFKRRKAEDVYIGGFDVARGSHKSKSGDDFSFSVYMNNQGQIPTHVLTVRKNNVTAEQMAGMVHLLHRDFGFSLIMYDPNGGGLFVRDELLKTEIRIENRMTNVTPIVEFGSHSGAIGDVILVPFLRSSYYISQAFGKLRSDSVLINLAHKGMKSAIENRQVILAGESAAWEAECSNWDIDAKRAWLNSNKSLNKEQVARAEMDLAVSQLIMVDVERDENGMAKLDSFGMYKFKSKHKKDSAYSLVYGKFGCTVWDHMIREGFEEARKTKKELPISMNYI